MTFSLCVSIPFCFSALVSCSSSATRFPVHELVTASASRNAGRTELAGSLRMSRSHIFIIFLAPIRFGNLEMKRLRKGEEREGEARAARGEQNKRVKDEKRRSGEAKMLKASAQPLLMLCYCLLFPFASHFFSLCSLLHSPGGRRKLSLSIMSAAPGDGQMETGPAPESACTGSAFVSFATLSSDWRSLWSNKMPEMMFAFVNKIALRFQQIFHRIILPSPVAADRQPAEEIPCGRK